MQTANNDTDWRDLLTELNDTPIVYEGQTYDPETNAVGGSILSGNPNIAATEALPHQLSAARHIAVLHTVNDLRCADAVGVVGVGQGGVGRAVGLFGAGKLPAVLPIEIPAVVIFRIAAEDGAAYLVRFRVVGLALVDDRGVVQLGQQSAPIGVIVGRLQSSNWAGSVGLPLTGNFPPGFMGTHSSDT